MPLPLRWFLVFCVCLVLQSTLVPAVGIMGVQPDLLVVVLFLLAIRQGTMAGVYVGFFLGLLQDLYTPSILGQTALAKCVMGFFAGLFNERIMRTDPIMKIAILAAAFLLHDTVFTLTGIVKNGAPMAGLASELLVRTLPRTAYSLVVAAIIYFWDYMVRPSLKQ